MRKGITGMLLVFLLLTLCPGAMAGYNEMIVATDGKGVAVYTSSSGAKQAGVLYNGYVHGLSLESTNGLYTCDLTWDYTVYVDQDKAGKREAATLCDAFLAEVCQENAPLYTTPARKHVTARHAPGTLVTVFGEFGDCYFADGGEITGFFLKSALKKVGGLTFAEANSQENTPYIAEGILHTGGRRLYPSASATGYSEVHPYQILQDGQTVHIRAYLGDWVQLREGGFIEQRYLDPDGDHAPRCATVKTDQPLNRLNVRYAASSDSWVEGKLCGGAQVEVISQTDEWAYIVTIGESSQPISGCVQKKYLAFGADAAKVKNGCTRVRLEDDAYYDRSWRYAYHELQKYQKLSAGTEVTVVGVLDGFDAESDSDTDTLLILTDDGYFLRLTWDGTPLTPIETLGISVKTASSVRMRSAPRKDSDALRTLSSGTKVEVLLRGEGWTMVKYKDQTGYVMSRYLRFP